MSIMHGEIINKSQLLIGPNLLGWRINGKGNKLQYKKSFAFSFHFPCTTRRIVNTMMPSQIIKNHPKSPMLFHYIMIYWQNSKAARASSLCWRVTTDNSFPLKKQLRILYSWHDEEEYTFSNTTCQPNKNYESSTLLRKKIDCPNPSPLVESCV